MNWYDSHYETQEKIEYCKTDKKIIVRQIIETYYDLDEEESAKRYEEKLKDQIERNKNAYPKGHTK